MNAAKPPGADAIEKSSELQVGRSISAQIDRGAHKLSAEELAASWRRLSDAPIREIESLISQLQKLRTHLKNAGSRIQDDIAGYTELSQQAMQLTSIIVDSVRKLPTPR